MAYRPFLCTAVLIILSNEFFALHYDSQIARRINCAFALLEKFPYHDPLVKREHDSLKNFKHQIEQTKQHRILLHHAVTHAADAMHLNHDLHYPTHAFADMVAMNASCGEDLRRSSLKSGASSDYQEPLHTPTEDILWTTVYDASLYALGGGNGCAQNGYESAMQPGDDCDAVPLNIGSYFGNV